MIAIPAHSCDRLEVVLLDADGLEHDRRQHRPDLRAALETEPPRLAGEETGTEGIADTRGINDLISFE